MQEKEKTVQREWHIVMGKTFANFFSVKLSMP